MPAALAPRSSGADVMTSRPAPKAILFDMDGVLIRSEEIWFRVLEEAGRRFRGRPVTREEFLPTFGQGTAADREVFGLQCSVEELDRFFVQTFSQHVDGVWVDPEAAPLLDALAAHGIRRGVVTNTVTTLAAQVLTAADLQRRVQSVSCADLVEKAKPAPDLVRHGLAALSVTADEAWMVGDSRFDREAAHAAGVFFVGYRMDGDARVDSLAELQRRVCPAPP